MTIRTALVGSGAWGKNILRVLAENRRAHVVAVADKDPSRRARAAEILPGVELVETLGEALALGIDAALLATPAHTHTALALEAMSAGADVFVEKPLAMSTEGAERCARKAAALGRIGMVGHLLRYHPTVMALLELARSGALGELCGVDSERLSTSGDRSAEVLWTLGPHDLSVLHALDPSPIRRGRASGPASGDEALLEIELESRLTARVALSRTSASKERRFVVMGAELSAAFDDVRAPDRVLFGQTRRLCSGRLELTVTDEKKVSWREPLAIEIDHFLQCVEERREPLTSFSDGARVVESLSLLQHGALFSEGLGPHARSQLVP